MLRRSTIALALGFNGSVAERGRAKGRFLVDFFENGRPNKLSPVGFASFNRFVNGGQEVEGDPDANFLKWFFHF